MVLVSKPPYVYSAIPCLARILLVLAVAMPIGIRLQVVTITTKIPEKIDQIISSLYRVVKKKVLHKSEEKIHKKLKMALQRAKNLVHVKQHYGVSFYEKIFFLH